MRKAILLSTLALTIAAGAGAAEAGSLGRPCTDAPATRWMSIEALQAKVEAMGYKVRKAKLKNACGEIYTTDPSGARVELFVDPTSGEIVGRL